MIPFLYKIAEVFHSRYGNELYRHTFVFPNRRAGFFFQKYLAEIAGKPLFSPSVTTIQELFVSLSSYRSADKIELLVMLYDHFGRVSGSDEMFDDFLFWGEMLLNDFNDVDKYMADARQLFRNVHDFRSMDDDMAHLSEKQKEAIRRFWTNFMPVGESKTKRKFQETWQVLHELYISFRDELQRKGIAYEGMMFREVAERAQARELDMAGMEQPQSFIFVGLNALTPAETILLDYLKNLAIADFYWDYESPLVCDSQNRASLWVEENQRRFPSAIELGISREKMGINLGGSIEMTGENEHFSQKGYKESNKNVIGHEQDRVDTFSQCEKPTIEVIGIPSGVGQAKQVSQILSQLLGSGAIPNPDEAINTAIVLPDERLLLPVLYSIPEEIRKINVTMGYGLSYSSISVLVEHIAALQRNMRELSGEKVFYHRNVLSILNHPFVYTPAKEMAEKLKTHILTNNRIVVSETEIPQHPLFQLIFKPLSGWSGVFEYLKNILTFIYKSLTESKYYKEEFASGTAAKGEEMGSAGEPLQVFGETPQAAKGEEMGFAIGGDREESNPRATDGQDLDFGTGEINGNTHTIGQRQMDGGGESRKDTTRATDLEREFIVQYHKTVTRLQDKLHDVENMSMDTCFRLLKKMAHSISVAFSGEPLSGLQVMGVLETRAIDFENLIILSMNEGVFPLKDPVNSFIPFTLRKGFGLPVYEHQDSTYAYHFYRMISRAKRVYMLYDTRTEEMQTGEVSRYFYQMKYLYPTYFEIKERVVGYDVSAPEVLPVSVVKTPGVMRKLDSFRQGGNSCLSASLINNYINCPLQFYFTAVEGLYEEEEVRETIESDLFGSIYHKMMEKIYDRYKGKTVTPDVLLSMMKEDALITKLLEQAFADYYFKQSDEPRPLLGQHYLIGEILRSYVKQTLETDKQFTPFEFVGAEQRFNVPYYVKNGLTVNFKGIIDRVDRVGDSHRIIDYKTGVGSTDFKQVADLFDASKANRPYQILQVFVYALFYAVEHPEAKLAPAIYYLRSIFGDFSPGVTCNRHPISDISVFMDEFLSFFNNCLEEIFNPEIPFTQTKNQKNCEWCAFKDICGR